MAVADPWVRWDWVGDNGDRIAAAAREHIELTVLAVGVGLAIALPLGVLAAQFRRVEWPVLVTTGALYTIPSLALFAVLAPVTGLSATTVVIGLTAYTLLVLVRNLLAGLDGVPADVIEAARGMGVGPVRMLLRVELPLALPTILAGVRVATVSTVALVTVGVVVSNGGLGQLIFAGFNNNLYRAEIFTATALCVLLALLADLLLVGLERLLTPWARR